jgi:hypothetical protein
VQAGGVLERVLNNCIAANMAAAGLPKKRLFHAVIHEAFLASSMGAALRRRGNAEMAAWGVIRWG